MTTALARTVLSLAICCLGESRREWACAMCGEFDDAVTDGRPLRFATGCLGAAWGEMPSHAEGRLLLARYLVVLGVLLPMAALQFALTLGFPSVIAGGELFGGALLTDATHNPILFTTQVSAAPCLLALWLLLGLAHLRLAWVLADGDWVGVTKVGAFISATLVTLFIVTATLALDVTMLTLQAAAVAGELTLLMALARRDMRRSLGKTAAFSAG